MSLRSCAQTLSWLGLACLLHGVHTGTDEVRGPRRNPHGLAVLRELDLCPRSPEATDGRTLNWASFIKAFSTH